MKLWIANDSMWLNYGGMKWDFTCLATMSIASLMVASCSQFPSLGPEKTLEDIHKEKQKKENASLVAYQQAGGRINIGNTDMVTTAGVVSPRNTTMLGVTSEEDTVWAPEDENEEIGENFESVWKSPENKSWHKDFSVAGKLSRNSGKPIILWFTHSGKSPQCDLLNRELMLTPEFETWAKENTIRVTLDSMKDGNSNEDAKRVDYVNRFKKRYNVNGYPSIYVLSPSGEVVDKHHGYKKGSASYYHGRLKHSVDVAANQHGAWREKMEKRGYRMWTSRGGGKVFAKLYRFKSDSITLIEPNGKRGTTSFSKLSDADQAWVLLEKKKYDQAKGG